jgi:hypothetical protein
MKNVFLAFLALTFISNVALAKGHPPMIQTVEATMNICPVDLMGCTHRINVEGETIPFIVDEQAKKASTVIRKMIDIFQQNNLRNTPPFTVTGYFEFRRAWPNPTVEQLVFVITDVSGITLP